MKAYITLAAVLAVVHISLQASAAGTATNVQLKNGYIASKPTCCFKCTKACYDADQQRYTAVGAVIKSATASKAKVCGTCTPKACKCPAIDFKKTLKSNTYVDLKKFQQFDILSYGVKAYVGFVAIFNQYNSFSVRRTGLTLNKGSKLEFKSKDTWFSVDTGSFSMTASQIKGSLRLFNSLSSAVSFDKSDIVFTDTVVNAVSSDWKIQDSLFAIQWTKGVVAPAPGYIGSYPFVATNTRIAVNRGILRFVNVKDAFFYKSTLQGTFCTIVLVNSNIRFIEGTLSLKNVNIEMTDSSLTLHSVKMPVDRYLIAVSGKVSGVPKGPAKPLDKIAVTLKGTGKVALKSVP